MSFSSETFMEMLPDEVIPFLGREHIYPEEARDLASILFTDDDTDPIPENIPEEGDNLSFHEGEWGHNNICFRKKAGGNNALASVLIPNEFPLTVTIFRLFEAFFFKSFIIDVLLPNINHKMQQEMGNDNEDPVTHGEFLRWIGLWLLMATTDNQSLQDYWSQEPISPYYGAPFRLGELMSQKRFELILKSLHFTTMDPPTTYHDPFHPVRQMIHAWNINMTTAFAPSWVSCIHQSMSCWNSSTNRSSTTSDNKKYPSCPGFIFVPRKRWALGNKWHTLSCATSQVMYAVELEEGRDRPSMAAAPEFDDLGGKTVGRLLRLSRLLWNTGKVVLLDDASCVDQGLTELAKKGVFATAPIKKRVYWPKRIDVDKILANFEDAAVGSWDCYRMDVPDYASQLEVYGFKEPEHVSMFLSTFGTMERAGPKKLRKWTSTDGLEHEASFQYPELVHHYRQYTCAGEYHDVLRQSPFTIEKTLSLDSWPHQIFAFLLAITEINVMNAWVKVYGKPAMSTIAFRKQLAKELIHNSYLPEQVRVKKETPVRGRPPSLGKRGPPTVVGPRGGPTLVGKKERPTTFVKRQRARPPDGQQTENPTAAAAIVVGQQQQREDGPTVGVPVVARAASVIHTLMSLPTYYRFQGTNLIRTDIKYPQRNCSICQRKCRDYCSCSPGTMVCNRCFAIHAGK